MNLGQRVVLVVATFFGFGLAADMSRAAWYESQTTGGWFNYSPNSGVMLNPVDGTSWLEDGSFYVIALLLWTALALWLLRPAALRGKD
jgi:hypothetical protein